MPVRLWGLHRALRLAVESVKRAKRKPADPPAGVVELDGRGYARRVEPPWQSSPTWDTYDLSVSNSLESDWHSWFSFDALAWQPIRVEAEASMPGSILELTLFSPEDDSSPCAVARTDAQGRAALSRLAHAGGLHLLRVRVAERNRGIPQRYRLSIAGPSSLAGADAANPPHSEFADVPLWHPYRDAIQALTETGVLSGSVSGKQAVFAPDLPVWVANFEHALAWLPSPHTRTHFLSRASPSLWHAQTPKARAATDGIGERMISRVAAVQAVVEALASSSPGALDQPPQDFASSFEVASLLGEDAAARARALRVAEYCGLLSGLLGFGAGWDATGAISRGETAQLVHAAMTMVRMPETAEETEIACRDEGGPWWLESATDLACASDDELTSDFVPDAQQALDGLMDGLVADDVPSDTEAITVDGASMRTVIEKMRADRGARQSEGARRADEVQNGPGDDGQTEPGGGQLDPPGEGQAHPPGDTPTVGRRYPNLRMGWPPAKAVRDRVHDQAQS